MKHWETQMSNSYSYAGAKYEYIDTEHVPLDDCESTDTFTIVKTQHTSSSGRYTAVYSSEDYSKGFKKFERELKIFSGDKQLFTVQDYAPASGVYFLERNGTEYLLTVPADMKSINVRDLDGTIIHTAQPQYAGNRIYTTDHVDGYLFFTMFSFGLQCIVYGLISVNDLFNEQNPIIIVTTDICSPEANGVWIAPGKKMDAAQYDKLFREGTITNIANLDHIGMWPEKCTKIWNDNRCSALRRLLQGQPHPRVVYDNPPPTSIDGIDDRIELNFCDTYHDEYNRYAYWLLNDTEDLYEKLADLLFLDYKSSNYEDLNLDHEQHRERCFVVNKSWKVKVYCDLVEYQGVEEYHRTYYVNDPKQCKIHVEFTPC